MGERESLCYAKIGRGNADQMPHLAIFVTVTVTKTPRLATRSKLNYRLLNSKSGLHVSRYVVFFSSFFGFWTDSCLHFVMYVNVTKPIINSSEVLRMIFRTQK